MKAKLFVAAALMEIRLEDDTVYLSNEEESQGKFVKRVTAEVEKEFLESLELAPAVDLKKIKKQVSASLERRLPLIPKGAESEMIREVLTSRGVKLTTAAKDIEVKDPKNVKGGKGKGKTTKDKPAPATPTERQEAIAAMKATKAYKTAQKHVGDPISFSPFKSKKVVKGTIKNLSLNKKLTKIYYSIETGKGKNKRRVSCAVDNKSITIG